MSEQIEVVVYPERLYKIVKLVHEELGNPKLRGRIRTVRRRSASNLIV